MNHSDNSKTEFEIERDKMVYDQSVLLHRYFLEWRYKLLAGFIVTISTIIYFIFTWLQQPKNFSQYLYILVCCGGIIITIVFALLNNRVTGLIWKCQNVAYLFEKRIGIENGLYSNLLTRKIKVELNKNGSLEKLPRASFCDYFNPFKHTGTINSFFVLVILAFISMFFLTGSLIDNKIEWDKNQKIIFQQKYDKKVNIRY